MVNFLPFLFRLVHYPPAYPTYSWVSCPSSPLPKSEIFQESDFWNILPSWHPPHIPSLPLEAHHNANIALQTAIPLPMNSSPAVIALKPRSRNQAWYAHKTHWTLRVQKHYLNALLPQRAHPLLSITAEDTNCLPKAFPVSPILIHRLHSFWTSRIIRKTPSPNQSVLATLLNGASLPGPKLEDLFWRVKIEMTAATTDSSGKLP